MSEQATRLPDKQPTLRVMPMPADVNHAGDIFGGYIMANVDLAGGIVAIRRARGRVATIAVNQFLFKQPVSVGDVLSFYAERHPTNPLVVKVTEAQLTYVAVDAEGGKREVPPEL